MSGTLMWELEDEDEYGKTDARHRCVRVTGSCSTMFDALRLDRRGTRRCQDAFKPKSLSDLEDDDTDSTDVRESWLVYEPA